MATCACPQESGINLFAMFSLHDGMVALPFIMWKGVIEVTQPIFPSEGGITFIVYTVLAVGQTQF